jgi:hypothetical protein
MSGAKLRRDSAVCTAICLTERFYHTLQVAHIVCSANFLSRTYSMPWDSKRLCRLRVATEFTESTEAEEQAGNKSNFASDVPPLRGLMLHSNTAPQLPQWATLFRP